MSILATAALAIFTVILFAGALAPLWYKGPE